MADTIERLDLIDLPSGNWAKVKRGFGFKELMKLRKSYLAANPGKKISGIGSLENLDMLGKILAVIVVDWSYKTTDGRPLPINEDTLKAMFMLDLVVLAGAMLQRVGTGLQGLSAKEV